MSTHPRSQYVGLRYIVMLQSMPINRWLTVKAISERLANRGFVVHERTIQRDLWKLSTQFGLEEIDVGHKKCWRRTLDLEQMRGQKAA